MLKKILIGLLVIILLIVGYLYYLGLFSKVEFKESNIGPFLVVYDTHLGDYSKVGPVMDKVYKSLKNDGIVTSRGFGMYYDDPKTVPADKLRSEVGSIIEEKDIKILSKFGKKYKSKIIKKSDVIIAEFPFKNQLSIIVGVIKVYPVMSSYIKGKNLKMAPIIEIYDMPNQKILYIMQIRK